MQQERKVYSARVILSVEAMTAAVQVWDREKKMLTVAQTIGTNQIPLPSQVSPHKPTRFPCQVRSVQTNQPDSPSKSGQYTQMIQIPLPKLAKLMHRKVSAHKSTRFPCQVSLVHTNQLDSPAKPGQSAKNNKIPLPKPV